jgi:hypothetical protein
MAGEIARQMAATPTEPRKEKSNPIAKLLGKPTFRLVANPKWYEDKYDKAKSNMRLAHVDFVLGNLVTISASIYMERTIEQRADGRYAQKFERFSLPKGITVGKDDAEGQIHLEEFKNEVLDGFDAWIKNVEQSSGGKVGRSSGRSAGVERLEA